jgi:hypothetical protein
MSGKIKEITEFLNSKSLSGNIFRNTIEVGISDEDNFFNLGVLGGHGK